MIIGFILGVVVALVVGYFWWYDAEVQRILRGGD